jgi:DNA-binding MarR family transcriptional regulator
VPGGVALLGGMLLGKLLWSMRVRRRQGEDMHPRAKRLLDAILRQPGLTLRRLRADTGLANGVAHHHLDRLLGAGLVVAHRHRNALLLFENHGRYAATWRQVAALRDPLNRRLHRWLAANPSATQAQTVQASQGWGWRRSLTQKRLALLEQAGLVERRREGRLVRHVAQPLPLGLDAPDPFLGASPMPALDSPEACRPPTPA